MIHPNDIVEYIIILIAAFAHRYALSESAAYSYLKQYGGISLAHDYYDVMHTQSFDDMVDSLVTYCHRKGGNIQ